MATSSCLTGPSNLCLEKLWVLWAKIINAEQSRVIWDLVAPKGPLFLQQSTWIWLFCHFREILWKATLWKLNWLLSSIHKGRFVLVTKTWVSYPIPSQSYSSPVFFQCTDYTGVKWCFQHIVSSDFILLRDMHTFTVTRVVGPGHQAGLGSAMPGEVVELMVATEWQLQTLNP